MQMKETYYIIQKYALSNGAKFRDSHQVGIEIASSYCGDMKTIRIAILPL